MLAAMPPLAATARQAEISALPREPVKLVAPPFVHADEQVATGGPQVVELTMTIEEKPAIIDDDGTTLQGMTFNGSIPGPLMVVHEGDYIELTLINPASRSMPHNIDFHVATGGLAAAHIRLLLCP